MISIDINFIIKFNQGTVILHHAIPFHNIAKTKAILKLKQKTMFFDVIIY
jgi:hypothetical protein